MYLQNLYLHKPEALMRVKLSSIVLHYDAFINHGNRHLAQNMILAKTRKLICTQIYHHFLSEYYNTQLMNTSLGNYDYIENCIGLYCKGYDCMSLQLYHVYRNRIKIFGSRCRGTNKKMAT